jgi:hypothetical protein
MDSLRKVVRKTGNALFVGPVAGGKDHSPCRKYPFYLPEKNIR